MAVGFDTERDENGDWWIVRQDAYSRRSRVARATSSETAEELRKYANRGRMTGRESEAERIATVQGQILSGIRDALRKGRVMGNAAATVDAIREIMNQADIPE